MSDIEVRHAQNTEGDAVGELARKAGFNLEGLRWDNIHPHWIIAVREEKLLGAMQIFLGRPVARLEMLCVDPELSHRDRARTVDLLIENGGTIITLYGAQLNASVIPFREKSYKNVLKRRGGWVADSGNVVMAWLR